MSQRKKVVQRITDPVFYRKRKRDFFRRFHQFRDSPIELDVANLNAESAVVIVAHPDDETFCSGLICALIERGVEVQIFCLTKGEGGPTGGLERSELGSAREKEMREACAILGVNKVTFAGFVDPVARSHRVFAPDVSVEDLSARVADWIAGFDLVISHGSCGEYWHPAHLLVYDAVKLAVESSTEQPQWLRFLARSPAHEIPRIVNDDDEAAYFFDATGFSEKREAALACHQSQIALFGRFADGDYRDFIRKTSRETYSVPGTV